MTNSLRLNPADNVAVSISGLKAGDEALGVKVLEDIPAGHKFALEPIAKDSNVVKYAFPIGHATVDIAAGGWVHVHNTKTNLCGTETYSYTPEVPEVKELGDHLTFDGFMRADGEVGVRNEIWIIPTVGCVNAISERLAKIMNGRIPAGSTVQGVHAWVHPYGCSQLGDDHAMTQKILKGLVKHPNAGGVLVIGLGCENNTMKSFKAVLGDVNNDRVKFLVAQEVADEEEAALELLEQLVAYAGSFKREPVPVSKLRIGLKCGGSDGFSGITANPLVGALSDLLVQRGGTTVLTEVPEMFGAEGLLMNRCVNKDIFEKAVKMINGFKDYFLRHNQVVYENPSPGNKDGGITTLEDKSLGCTQKGGTSPVVDVLAYGDWLKTPGLNLLTGPGNDIVAVTVLAAAGAHIVLFTTGRGTPLGGPVPTVKLSTNTALSKKKPKWIDFNAGVLLEGVSMDQLATDFFKYVVEVASGKQTRNEENEYREIAIFKDGVTL